MCVLFLPVDSVSEPQKATTPPEQQFQGRTDWDGGVSEHVRRLPPVKARNQMETVTWVTWVTQVTKPPPIPITTDLNPELHIFSESAKPRTLFN
jgi:hypothetical protein